MMGAGSASDSRVFFRSLRVGGVSVLCGVGDFLRSLKSRTIRRNRRVMVKGYFQIKFFVVLELDSGSGSGVKVSSVSGRLSTLRVRTGRVVSVWLLLAFVSGISSGPGEVGWNVQVACWVYLPEVYSTGERVWLTRWRFLIFGRVTDSSENFGSVIWAVSLMTSPGRAVVFERDQVVSAGLSPARIG